MNIEKKLRIGVICDQFGNLQRGGAEIQADNTVRYLQKSGKADVEFITYETRDLSRYDIVHIFKSLSEFVPVELALKQAGIPCVISTIIYPRNYFFELLSYKLTRMLPGRLKSLFNPARRVMLWDNADYLFPNTDKEAEFVGKVTHNKHIQVVPNGIDLEEFTETDPSLFQAAYPDLKGKKFVLNVARIEKRKNQKNLLLACKDLNIPLVVIGKIGDQEYYEEIRQIGYKDFHYLGPIYDRQLLFSAYAACQVFCLPSTLETPGIAAMEAAYYDKPVIVTKYGGTQYYFKDKAYYVEWKDINDIRKAIQVMSDKTSCNTRQMISEYSWANIAESYIKMYHQILDSKKTGRQQ